MSTTKTAVTNEMDFATEYIVASLNQNGVTPTLVDNKFQDTKTLINVFGNVKSEVYLNPTKDSGVIYSLWFKNGVIVPDNADVRKATKTQVNIRTRSLDVATKYIMAYVDGIQTVKAEKTA